MIDRRGIVHEGKTRRGVSAGQRRASRPAWSPGLSARSAAGVGTPSAPESPSTAAPRRSRPHPADDLEHEVKFLLPESRVGVAQAWLRTACQPDPEFPSGTVWTVYYDTRSLASLREKVNSDYLKTKVRIRWYGQGNEPPSGRVFAEVKRRVGSRREKLRIETAHRGEHLSRLPLDHRVFEEIVDDLRAPRGRLPLRLRPVVLVRYRRCRFTHRASDTRLSLDFDISAARVNRRLLPHSNPLPVRAAVFELKGHESDLPPLLRRLVALGARKKSFSKYEACCRVSLSARR